MINTNCPLCSEQTVTLISTFKQWEDASIKNNEHVALRNAYNQTDVELASKEFFQCNDCKVIFLSPLLSNQELSAFYTSYHANENAITKTKKKIKRATRRIKTLKVKSNAKTFLDVGCNVGTAVEAARCLGLDATGIEIDASATDIAKKQFPECTFININVEEHSKSKEKYDLVYCSEVIEHVPDPLAFANALYHLVNPGGLLFITTPDSGHLLRPKDFISWNEVKPPEHIFWYNKESIKRLLLNAGFDQVNFRLNLKPGIKLNAYK
jgi:2-polyprenyl-3-methyl-5-hydroxy-6-metoxy-1,4-benzoquinol methylase